MTTKIFARSLRKNSTNAEIVLWHYLRGRRLGGYKFRRQVVIEPFIVDFVCYEAKLIIEADGGQHQLQQENDAQRTAELELMGYTVVRYWNNDILNNITAVLEDIQQYLNNIPSPQPSPRGRGRKNTKI